eukprot:c5155_g1_i1 orf=39-233(+)
MNEWCYQQLQVVEADIPLWRQLKTLEDLKEERDMQSEQIRGWVADESDANLVGPSLAKPQKHFN